jgi:hypothetical protein
MLKRSKVPNLAAILHEARDTIVAKSVDVSLLTTKLLLLTLPAIFGNEYRNYRHAAVSTS